MMKAALCLMVMDRNSLHPHHVKLLEVSQENGQFDSSGLGEAKALRCHCLYFPGVGPHS